MPPPARRAAAASSMPAPPPLSATPPALVVARLVGWIAVTFNQVTLRRATALLEKVAASSRTHEVVSPGENVVLAIGATSGPPRHDADSRRGASIVGGIARNNGATPTSGGHAVGSRGAIEVERAARLRREDADADPGQVVFCSRIERRATSFTDDRSGAHRGHSATTGECLLLDVPRAGIHLMWSSDRSHTASRQAKHGSWSPHLVRAREPHDESLRLSHKHQGPRR